MKQDAGPKNETTGLYRGPSVEIKHVYGGLEAAIIPRRSAAKSAKINPSRASIFTETIISEPVIKTGLKYITLNPIHHLQLLLAVAINAFWPAALG